MKKEHEKEHEKELQAIRVSNTVYLCMFCHAILCPLNRCLCLFTYDVTACTDGSERSGRKLCKTTSGTKGKSM